MRSSFFLGLFWCCGSLFWGSEAVLFFGVFAEVFVVLWRGKLCCDRVWLSVVAMGRPELREVHSVGSVLKQAGQLWRMCLIPICILALVSAIYSYTLETYALSPSLAFAQLDGNYSLSQKVNSSLGQSRNSQDLKTSRANFEGGLKEGSDDKGFVARYLAMFLTSLDEAVMESLAESREKMSAYESRAGDPRTASLKRDASQANYPTQVSEVSILFRCCRHLFCIVCVVHDFVFPVVFM